MGQFSMPIFTPCASANWMSGVQTSRKRGQLSSTERVQSRPMKVFTTRTPSSRAASITLPEVVDVDLRLGAVRRTAGWDSSPGR